MQTNALYRGLLAAIAALVMTLSPVAAVTDGYVDSANTYSFVGLMVAQDADGNPLWRCSGTLISSQLFLTAGHCVEDPAAHVEIWFNVDVETAIAEGTVNYPFDGPVSGTPYEHPNYYDAPFYVYDLGIVVLDTPVYEYGWASVIGLEELDAMATQRGRQNTSFTAVGYGLQASFPDAASWKDQSARVRMVSHPNLIQINNGIVGDYSILLSNNAHTGGTCFGDSGGPNFLDGTFVIAGVTSYGVNGNCAGTGGVYRIDQPDDYYWIQEMLALYPS